MVRIEKLHGGIIKENRLGFFKADAVLFPILLVFYRVPSEMELIHNYNIIIDDEKDK